MNGAEDGEPVFLLKVLPLPVDAPFHLLLPFSFEAGEDTEPKILKMVNY